MSRPGPLALLTALLLIPALFVGTASAGKPKVKSEISYRNFVDGLDFVHQGRIRSDDPACERGRKVKLFTEGGEEPLGQDRTDNDGRYRIVLKSDSLVTDYYTRTGQVEKSGVICKAAESKHKGLGPS